MTQRSPFLPQYDDLPETIAIFPLLNAVVLPGGFLPLNIFEPRYINMVQDALRNNHLIGMVQPNPATPPVSVSVADSNAIQEPDASQQSGRLDVYPIGCAGRIFKYQETLDGRIELALVGVSRFRIKREIAGTKGYRQVQVDWSDYQTDFETSENIDPELDRYFRAALRHYMNDQQLKTDWSTLEQLRVGDLCNSILSFLPLTSDDKQLLLETPSLARRIKAFSAILLNARITSPPTTH